MSNLVDRIFSRREILKSAVVGAGTLIIPGCSKDEVPRGPEPVLEEISNIIGKHIWGVALYHEGQFHFFGGYAIWSCIYRSLDLRQEVFDIETGQVSSVGEMSHPLAEMGYFVHNDRLFVLGGNLAESITAPDELTDIVISRSIDSPSWEPSGRFPHKINYANGLVLNDKPHVFGGQFEDKTKNPYMWVLDNGEWLNIAEMSPVLSVLSNTVFNSKIYSIAYQYKGTRKYGMPNRYEYLLIFDGNKFSAKKLPKAISNYSSQDLFVHDKQLYLLTYDSWDRGGYLRSALFTYSDRRGWQKQLVFKIPDKLEHYPFQLFHDGSMYFFGRDFNVKDECGYRIQLVPFKAKPNSNF